MVSDTESGFEEPSDSSVPAIRYAAVRVLVDDRAVSFVSIDMIKDFNPANRRFPYNAIVCTGFDENEEEIFEAAIVLDTAGSLL